MYQQLINKLSTEFSTPIPIFVGKEEGWRIRAKLAVRGTIETPKIGLFKPGTHEVEDLIDCPDHHPAINEALKALRAQTFLPYNETTQTGDLRYVQLTFSRTTKKVQLVLVANGKDKCLDLAMKLQKAHDWHSIWINFQEGSTNTIFRPTWLHLYGPRYLEEELLERLFHFHPACFIQANLYLFEKILLDIKQQVDEGHITELYAGVGIISRIVNRPSTLVESNPYAKESFFKSDPPPYLEYITGKSEDHIHRLQEILIVDPPRKGLDPKVLEATANLKQIFYLSCNPETLKSAVKVLQEQGWEIKNARGYHLFPNTQHVEILLNLRKSG